MTGIFKNKYRIPSARAQWWDYSNPGVYFVTLCTHRRECLFGTIQPVETHGGASHDGASLRESPIGNIVLQEWHKSFDIRVELLCDAFVLMPNHLHAILRIDNTMGADTTIGAVTHGRIAETHSRIAETHSHAPLRVPKTTVAGDSQSQVMKPNVGIAYRPPESISSFVAGFKSTTTKKINVLRNTPGTAVWQPRFHDYIIRNMTEYQSMADYIENNPTNWRNDQFWAATLL